MSDNSEEIAALRAKVKQLQEQLSKIGQPKRPSQKERNAALKAEGGADKSKNGDKSEWQSEVGGQALKSGKGKAEGSSGASGSGGGGRAGCSGGGGG